MNETEEPGPRSSVIKNLDRNDYEHLLKVIRGGNGLNLDVICKTKEEKFDFLADIVEIAAENINNDAKDKEKKIFRLNASLDMRIHKGGDYGNFIGYLAQRLESKGDKYTDISKRISEAFKI
ncbi:MAG TPA: hypothetical protein VJB94_04585 [Candidatus Nanoarchaeia archaeon]|nr:hypothetical protein [Candidatus Nanoarchaeia archaeon]